MDRRRPLATQSASFTSSSSETQVGSTPLQRANIHSHRNNIAFPLYQYNSDGSSRSARHRSTQAAVGGPVGDQEGETLADFLRSSEESITNTRSLGQSSNAFTLAREDFLRRRGQVGRKPAASSTQSTTASGRKRTSSGAEPTGRRRPGYTGHGSSRSNPIDLTSSPEPSLPRLPNDGTERSQDGENILLPTWQADADVFKCPVCDMQFSFWYRKHHCRKCGRVVCSSCSPHRITIPRQFIVHPPPNSSSPIAVLSGITGLSEPQDDRLPASRSTTYPSGNSGANLYNRASLTLTGGEVVRVCNPCVPDPNLSPPPQRHAQIYMPPSLDPPHYTLDHQPSRRATVGTIRRSDHQPHANLATTTTRTVDSNTSSPRYTLIPPPPPFHPSASTSSLPHRRTPSASTPASLPALAPAPFSPLRRRSIPEEDECPVCGRELPPSTPADNDAARVQHVEACLAHYSTSVPVSTSLAPPPSMSTAQNAPGHPPPPLSPASASAAAAAQLQQQQQQRHRRAHGNRMLVYHATEKDCISNDYDADASAAATATAAGTAAAAGPTAAECVICFEEFEVGDEMGRLECLCRFHRACIRQWWDTKGVGSCPTHQLQL